ncbi:hypothetical protein PC129_g6863 [Phytophthora cactorum]|uniref:BED-type domain-containing protein n=1 Tax=Phytophthora cactorum TaxID=29920 RepID=A0A8T1IBL6_9STRA|nr:hypothetical protein Pcac1_g611 [Phytophthora cactorum]KAG2818009.1 hypothetical protein PC112_g12808 [Phytophthora cactorum]KAG2831787.1 hypothetical protein PC111_g6865 [Phytophthora cactorum]KAG2855920.1 hypothetical protein PC113_g12018 [Phytophthora cactorum]KAG2912696.1 hypothetical protein PC115_g12255 [Phytophthora cactorum]
MVANRERCAFFFQPLGEALHRCKICGADRKQLPGTGYSNLVSHLASRHEDFRAEYDNHHRGIERSLQDFGYVCEETSHRYQWLRWVVERSMPPSEVDDEGTRAMAKWRSTNSEAVKKDMITVASNLLSVISEEVGDLHSADYPARRGETTHWRERCLLCLGNADPADVQSG